MRDRYTNNDISLHYEHYLIHDAQIYNASCYLTVTAASSQDVMIICGSCSCHSVFEVAVSGQALVTLYEGVTINSGAGNTGTAVNIFNMNRESSDSCGSLVFKSQATAINWSAGAAAVYHVLYQDQLPGGEKAVSMVGSQLSRNSEWILKGEQKYLVRVTNQAASTITATVNLRWYEQEL